jgi:hypothetical protein
MSAMFRTFTVAAAILLTSTAFVGTANAKAKPTISEVSIYVTGLNNADRMSGVTTKIVRTDRKAPTGVRVCLQYRNWNVPTKVTTVACGYANRAGVDFFRHSMLLTNGDQWRVFHPNTKALAAHYGRWRFGI